MRLPERKVDVALISGPRAANPMGLELAECSLLNALRDGRTATTLDYLVVGGRAARAHARRTRGRWVASRPGHVPRRTWARARLFHLLSLELGPPPPGVRFVVSVHDLAPLRFDDEGPLPPWTAELLRRSEVVLTVSEFTARELRELLEVPAERIRVVRNGPGQDLSGPKEGFDEDALADFGLRGPVVLRMGGYTRRKNVASLLNAWPAIHAETGASLALLGPDQPARRAALEEAPSLDGVRVFDYLPADTVARLLRSASVLVITSTYEGFGLPALESMSAGVPVVAFAAGAVEEVCGDAAAIVADDGAMASTIIDLLADAGRRRELVERGRRRVAAYDWSDTAARHLEVYRDLLHRPRP